MTLHPQEPAKRAVGVRELHDHLSRHLRAVEAGAQVVITSRGRPIAQLVPAREGDPLAELRERGSYRIRFGRSDAAGAAAARYRRHL